MVLLSITPLLDGVLRRDIIAPFHTSGPPLLQFHLAIEQWGFTVFDPAYYKNVNFTLPLSVNGTFCAFSTGYDAKGSTFLWHSMSHFNNVNVGVTGFVFDSRYTFTGLGYLAVCW